MFTDFQNLSSHTAESPLKYALACAAQSPGVLEAGREDGLRGYSKFRAQQQKPAVLACSPTPHLDNTVSRSLPTWFLPQDRGAQLRNPLVHVCSLGCHRTWTPRQCPQLHPCEDEPPGAPNSRGGRLCLPACNDEGQAATLRAVRKGRHHPKYEWQSLDHRVEHMSTTGSGERLTRDKGCWFLKVKELVR